MGAVLTPDVGSPILPTAPVVFDLTDSTETLTSILIAVHHDSGVVELAHDGTNFEPLYASGSTRVVITDGYRYSLVRAGGWTDTKVVVSAFPFAGSGTGLINFSSDFDVLADPPGEDVALSVTGVTAGTYGDSAHVARITTDSKGRISAAASVTIILANNSGTTIANAGSGGTTGTNVAIISDVDSRVATEATARAAADTSEATARAAADTTLTTNLNTEITNRIAGDLNAISVSEAFTLAQIAAAATSLEADGISTGSVQLSSLAFPAVGSVVARVKTVRDFFYLDRTSTLTADGITVVTALGGTGRWLRMRIADPFWRTQFSWTIDPGAGNDEGLGDAGHPLKTRSEFYRRIGTNALRDNTITVTILSSLLAGDTERPPGFTSDTASAGGAAFIKFVGTRRVLFTGTIDSPSGVTNRNGSTATPTSIKVSGLSSTWTAGDGVTSFLDPGVVVTDGTLFARPVQDKGTKTAWVSPPISLSNLEGTFTAGASITIYDVPSLGHDEFCPPGHVEYTDLKVSGGRFFATTGTVFQTNCSGDIIALGTNYSSSNGRTGIGTGQSFLAQGCSAAISGGFHRLIMPNGTGCRINVAPTLVALQVEAGATVEGNTQTPGVTQITADLEFCTPANLDSILFNGINGGRLIVAGYTYGLNNGTGYGVMLQGLGAHAQFAHVPQISGTNGASANFQLTSTVVALSTLATQSLTDINNNRIDGPAGPTWNDNRSQPLAHLGSGGTTPTNAANIGDVSSIAANAAFVVVNKAALIAIDTTSLSSGGVWRWVASYKAWFYLDKFSSLTADPDRVIAPTTGGGFWVRDESGGHPFWQAQTTWYIDPAGTNSTPGNDEADGLTSSTPIKSMAEWRRRIRGAVFLSNVVIHPLSSSTNNSDGIMDSFRTFGAATVVIIGTTTVLFSGTLTAGTSAYAGNNRGVIEDTSLTSWTASGAISTTGGGSRFIRKFGADIQADIISDLGSKKAMIGVTTTTSETTISPVSNAGATFAAGDAYQVVSRLKWPRVYTNGGRVQVQCMDISGATSTLLWSTSDTYVLCGFLTSMTTLGNVTFVKCLFLSTVVTNDGAPFFESCSFLATVQINSQCNLNGFTNVFVNATLQSLHGGQLTAGNVLAFDNTSTVISASRLGQVEFSGGSMAGSGNSGKLVTTASGSYVTSAALITASTSDPLPYSVNGAAYAAPVVDSGTGVYS